MTKAYAAFGLGIASEIPLPGLLPGIGDAEVSISHGPVPETLEGGTQVELFGWASAGKYLMTMPGHARFLVTTDSVTVEIFPQGEEEMISLLVERACLGILLQLRGFLVLQGSAVELEGEGLAIMTEGSMGASTLAYALLREGARLLADGLVAVKPGKDGMPELYPASSSLQLWNDMICAFGEEPDSFKRVRPGLDRRFVPSTSGIQPTGPIPPGKILFLGKHPQQGILVQEYAGKEKMKALLKCMHKKKLKHSLGTDRMHFSISMMMLQKMRISEVLFPSGSPFCAPDLARTVLEKL